MAAEKSVRYTYGIDFAKIEAIDIHTHVEVDSCGHKAYDDELVDATRSYFKMGADAESTDAESTVAESTVAESTVAESTVAESTVAESTVDDLAAQYRGHNAAAVVFTVDAQSAMGHAPNSVDELIAGVVRNNDVLIPFGSVDPWRGRDALRRIEELVGDFGVRGFKFHPSMQAFEPNDRRFYPIYEAITAAGVPALFHTGQTGIGSGLPGGHGIKLRYSDPMLLDDVAADFPDLTLVLAHPAVPWVDAQIAIATHKSNVYIDLSGYSPKYFPPQLVRAMGRALRTKVLFGTDHPYIGFDRWRRDFDALGIDPEVAPLIYKQNALRVLGLGG